MLRRAMRTVDGAVTRSMPIASGAEPVDARVSRQLLRYTIVGLGSNLLLFIAYLFLTSLGVGPKLAMTFVYAAGIIATYLLHGIWSFGASPWRAAALARYVFIYGVGYLLNFGLLWLLVDRAGWPHREVQGGAILLVAVFLFLLNKYWVFVPRRELPR